LRSLGIEVEETNTAKVSLTAHDLELIVRAAGSVAAVINQRHAIAKERGWASAPPTVKELAEAAAAEPNVIRRPILIVDGRAIIGFDRDAYAKLRA
jgi:arsenate reductase-like glutaredoxin family protein